MFLWCDIPVLAVLWCYLGLWLNHNVRTYFLTLSCYQTRSWSYTGHQTSVYFWDFTAHQPIMIMSSRSVYLNTFYPGQAQFHKRLTSTCAHSFTRNWQTALLESAKGRGWPQKIFYDQSPRKNVAWPGGNRTLDIPTIRLNLQGRSSNVTGWEKCTAVPGLEHRTLGLPFRCFTD